MVASQSSHSRQAWDMGEALAAHLPAMILCGRQNYVCSHWAKRAALIEGSNMLACDAGAED